MLFGRMIPQAPLPRARGSETAVEAACYTPDQAVEFAPTAALPAANNSYTQKFEWLVQE